MSLKHQYLVGEALEGRLRKNMKKVYEDFVFMEF